MLSSFLRSSTVVIVIGIPSLLLGQGDESFNHVTLSVGAGFTTSTAAIARDIDHGGNFELNGSYFFNPHIGIAGNFMFSDVGITPSALDALNEPNGSVL